MVGFILLLAVVVIISWFVRHIPGGWITVLVLLILAVGALIYAISGVVPTHVVPWF